MELNCNVIESFEDTTIEFQEQLRKIQENNAEKILIAKEMDFGLSEEAKFVLSLILDSPLEITQILMNRHGKITKQNLKGLLKQYGIGWFKAEKIFSEIKERASCLL